MQALCALICPCFYPTISIQEYDHSQEDWRITELAKNKFDELKLLPLDPYRDSIHQLHRKILLELYMKYPERNVRAEDLVIESVRSLNIRNLQHFTAGRLYGIAIRFLYQGYIPLYGYCGHPDPGYTGMKKYNYVEPHSRENSKFDYKKQQLNTALRVLSQKLGRSLQNPLQACEVTVKRYTQYLLCVREAPEELHEPYEERYEFDLEHANITYSLCLNNKGALRPLLKDDDAYYQEMALFNKVTVDYPCKFYC